MAQRRLEGIVAEKAKERYEKMKLWHVSVKEKNDFHFYITAYARFAIYEFVSCELLDTLHCEIKDSSHVVLSPCLAFGSVVERVGLSHFIAIQFYCKCSPCLTGHRGIQGGIRQGGRDRHHET